MDVPDEDKPKRQGRQHALTSLSSRKAPRKRALKAKDIAEVEKMRDALEMRKAGYTFERIAERLGFHDASGASKFVKRALELTIQESADEVRRMELERYDSVLRGILPKAEEGDARAAEVCIKLFERRAKIEGLDAPERKELAIEGELRNVTMRIDAARNPVAREGLHQFLRARPALPPAPGDVVVEGSAVEVHAGSD